MKRMGRCLSVLSFVLLFGVASWTNGQGPGDKPAQDDDKAPAIKLVLQPAADPHPALRYPLLPPLVDRRPGNAAVYYNRVPAERHIFFVDFFKRPGPWEDAEKWMEVPLRDPREKELRKPWESQLRGQVFIFDDLDRAARCEMCDWQLPIREQEFYSMLLPDLQQTRDFARLLTARTRLQIADGDFVAAAATLQTGMAMGRHVAQGQTLVHALVGKTICDLMAKRVEDWAQQPGSPNLYWSLTWLPRPLIDLRPGLEGEMGAVYLSHPDLRNLDTAKHTPEEWRRLLEKLVDLILRWGDGKINVPTSLVSTAAALRGYPMAKRALVAWGRPAAEVEAMPVAQVILIYTMRTYEDLGDDLFKWYGVPYPEARQGLAEADKSLRNAVSQGREVFPFASILLPAVQTAHFAVARGDRTIAMLRVVEALRLYGAAHGRRLPEGLAEIKEVPVPFDPVTGKPFLYQRTGNTAVLESPPVPGFSQRTYGVRYGIQFAR